MKYLLTVFLCLFSFFSYSQTSDSLLYIRCRNFQTISDSSLIINLLSKTEVKVWKDITTKNTLFIEPKEEGNIKIALTNSENDTVQIMSYKAVFLPLPVIELHKYGNTTFSIKISKKKVTISARTQSNTPKITTGLIDKEIDLRYRVNHNLAILKRNGRQIDSVFSKNPFAFTQDLMEKAKKGDTIIFRILNVQRMNYENKVEDIPLNVEFEYTIMD